MTDKRIKMDCPFCHTPPDKIQITFMGNSTSYGQIKCPECGCTFSGSGKQNLIDKWNRR